MAPMLHRVWTPNTGAFPYSVARHARTGSGWMVGSAQVRPRCRGSQAPPTAAPEQTHYLTRRTGASKVVSKLAYTDQFTCLDKAAMLTPEEDALCADGKTPTDPWRLCTMQQVEEVKCLARIIPVWSSGIVYFVVVTQLSTYVVLQAAQTDRRITASSSFQIPQGSFVVFVMLALTLSDPVVTMLVAAAVERRRRRIGPGSPMMSCFWLVPQQVLAGLSEAFAAIGQTEFYYRQFPENMRSVAGALYFLGWALASYASGLMVTILHRTTGWLAQDPDEGRVDLFYLVTGVIAAVNLVYFVACARWYRFKKSDDDHTGSGAGDAGLDESPKKAANAAPV
nr:protein NRT1/ PTR FAMILY 2.11-like [Lolium perenne]